MKMQEKGGEFDLEASMMSAGSMGSFMSANSSYHGGDAGSQ